MKQIKPTAFEAHYIYEEQRKQAKKHSKMFRKLKQNKKNSWQSL